MQIETKKTTLSPVPAIVQNCSLESSNVMEALGRLETQVSKLIYLSQSDPPTQRQQQPHDVLPHVRLYILASTVSSMLLAASIMHLGDIWQFDAIYAGFSPALIFRGCRNQFPRSPKKFLLRLYLLMPATLWKAFTLTLLAIFMVVQGLVLSEFRHL